MSKKMMKRSLALGALMAFVITGSAMAEQGAVDGDFGTINGNGKSEIFTDDTKAATIMGKGTITGFDSLTIESNYGNAIGRPGKDSNDGEITISANNINLKADNSFDNKGNNNGNAVTAYNNLNVTAEEDLTLLGNNRIIRATAPNPAPDAGNKIDEFKVIVDLKAENIYMNSDGNGEVTNELADDAAIKVDGASKVIIEANNNLFINAAGSKNPYAVYVFGNDLRSEYYKKDGAEGTVVMKAGKAIVNGAIMSHTGKFSFEGTEFELTSNDKDAIYTIGNKANVKVDSGKIKVTSNGYDEGYHAVFAASGSSIDLVDFTSLDVYTYNKTDDSTEGGTSVIASNGADVNITGASGAVANIYSEGRAAVAALAGAGTGAYDGDSNIVVSNVATLNLSSNPIANDFARKNSVLAVQNFDESKKREFDFGANVEITTDNLSVTNLSEVANTYAINVQGKDATLTINAGRANIVGAIKTDGGTSTLNLGENFTWDASNTGENTVTTLNGTGTVILADVNDKVTTTGTGDAASNAKLSVQANGALAEDIASDNDQASALQALADKVEGVEVTQVGTAEGEVAGAITAQVGEDGKVVASSVKEAVNTVNQAIGEAAVNFKAHYRAHMNDMNKRMGELRMANGETGVWTRMVRGENEFEGAKSQYNQYQLGYDEKLSVDKRWTVGAAVTFAEGTGNFSQGSTEDDSTAFAIYGSKLNNDGTFVDLIARYARLESDITMSDQKADYSTNGYSVSAEFGKRIQQGKGFWIEPQFELTYGSVDSAEYTINGKDVTVGDMDSLIGRVGFSLGKYIKQGNVYARASYMYDFDGETDTTFGKNGVTRTIEEDLGSGWWEVGVGANISLSKATYIYADIEKTFGGEIDTNWQWNLGVRYSF